MTFTFTLPDLNNPIAAFGWVFVHGGFVLVLIGIGYGIWWAYMEAIQNRYHAKQKHVLLAIDVPRENEQTPLAVEHIFSHLHGIYRSPTAKDKYIEGFLQAEVSVELVSIGGFVQYCIRAPVQHRDLVEAAIYAQYPNAEISEVEDYAAQVPTKYPDDEWDVWACELEETNKEAYPIRTYPLWEHSLTQTFVDPMAALLETMARLRDGEQIWLQWVLQPTHDPGWRKKGIALINKLVGIKVKKSASALESIANAPGALLQGTYDTITRTLFEPSSASNKREKEEPYSLMQHLPPHVRSEIEAIGIKISKTAFETKGRFVYIGRKEVFDKSRVSAVMGALKQYASLDLNGFKPGKMKTQVTYFRVEQRMAALKRKLILGYKYRSTWSGRVKYHLNIEELASLWHFPVITVKAPQVKKAEAKRGEPPVSLPVGEDVEYVPKAQPTAEAKAPAPLNVPTASSPAPTRTPGQAPDNLPIG